MLAKRLGDAWYTRASDPSLPEGAVDLKYVAALEKFFDEHFGCEIREGVDAYAFELHNESGPMAVIPVAFKSLP